MGISAKTHQSGSGLEHSDWEYKQFCNLALPRKERIDPGIKGAQPFCIELEHIEKGTGRLLGSAVAQERASLKSVFYKDDVLFGKLRAYLRKYWLADRQGVCSTEIWVLAANSKEAIPAFLFQLVKTDWFVEVASTAYGTHMPRSDWNVVKNLELLVPPTKEQLAIAQVLGDTDELIQSLDRLTAKKQNLKQATMQQLLTGKTRLPGFSGEWEMQRLGKVACIQRGASPRPIESPVWFDENSQIGWVRISDVSRSGMYLRETVQRLSPLGVLQSRPVAKGSLIMSICATVGRPIITDIDVCIHDGFVVFASLQTSKTFLYYFLKWIEPDWSKHGQTGSQMNLNTGLINNTALQLPKLPEQQAIAAVLSDMDAELSSLEAKRNKTIALKQGMMQELLTGRTRLI